MNQNGVIVKENVVVITFSKGILHFQQFFLGISEGFISHFH